MFSKYRVCVRADRASLRSQIEEWRISAEGNHFCFQNNPLFKISEAFNFYNFHPRFIDPRKWLSVHSYEYQLVHQYGRCHCYDVTWKPSIVWSNKNAIHLFQYFAWPDLDALRDDLLTHSPFVCQIYCSWNVTHKVLNEDTVPLQNYMNLNLVLVGCNYHAPLSCIPTDLNTADCNVIP